MIGDNMKNKKNVIIGLVLILTILIFFITYYCLYGKKETSFENKNLSGEKLTDGVYLYNIDIDDYTHGTKVINDKIYYWIELSDKYEFYSIDIYSNKKEKIGEFSTKDYYYYCYFESNYIDCSSGNNKVMFDYNFKKIYDGEQKIIVPFKDDFISLENNTIYYQNKEYRKIKEDISSYNYYDYDLVKDNIYLYFAGYRGSEGCLLNVKENRCENYDYKNIRNYSNGLYFFDEKEIHITNENNSDIKTYNNPTKDELMTLSQLKDNSLYYFNNDYLTIYNLENNNVKVFDYSINESVDDILLSNNLVYLISLNKVYIINLDEILLNEMTLDELDSFFEKKITEKIEMIKNEYNVDFKIRKEANLKIKAFNETMTGEFDYSKINDSLDDTIEIFEIFGKEFFKEFVHDEYTGIRIYLVSEIKSNFSKGGEAFRYYDKYAIIAKADDYKSTLYHELLHTLEDAAVVKNKKIFSKWNNYNPKNFKYKEKFNEYDTSYKYTVNYGDGDIYFIDNYSQTDALEDRARIFEYVCMNIVSNIKNNPYLLEKALYEKDEILKYYPMLKSSSIFDSLK